LRYAPELEQTLRRYLQPTNKSRRVDETYIRAKTAAWQAGELQLEFENPF
jgi:hypothetical protein